MVSRIIVILALALSVPLALADEQEARQAVVVLDEDLWVTFYDLPSRRFRAIRTAIINGDNETAAKDLELTANYLLIEAERSTESLAGPLKSSVDKLRALGESIDNVTLSDLDALYGRAHWLLAQHYLHRAKVARDARQNRNTGLYLLAATHHMERAILWSNSKVDRDVRVTLEKLRDLAAQLQQNQSFEKAYREKPVVRAEKLLVKIGKQINRPVLLPVQ